MSGIQQRWRKEMLGEINAALADQQLAFPLFQHINGRHDQLHYQVLASLDTQLRRAENLPPFLFCWFEMGSGGRSERTFWTDQDNGIVYQCLEKDFPLIENYLRRLADKAVSTLEEYGYPFCTGLVMANQPRWIASFDGWIKQWKQWGTELTLDSIRCLLISADMRPIYGDAILIYRMKQWLVDQESQVKWYPRLLLHTTSQQLPLGPFGQLLIERHGYYMGKFHLKEGGYYPLISLVRMLALHAGILVSSTKERLDQLCKAQYLTSAEASAWENALSFFLIARLKQHLILADAGQPIHDYVSLSAYSKMERQQLKEHVFFLKKQQKYWKKHLGAAEAMNSRFSHFFNRMLNRSPGANLEIEAWNRRHMRESNEQQRILTMPLRMLPIAAIDSETTGFHPEVGDEILSLASVRWKGGMEEETFHAYLQINGQIPSHISVLTGIKEEDLKDALPFQEVIPSFFKYVGNRVLLGYHIGHDIHFLNYYLWRKFRMRVNNRTFDMKMVLCLIDPKFQNFSLQEACDDFGMKPMSFHTAIGDATAVAHLWEKAVIQLEKIGVASLEQLYIHLSKINGN